MFEEFYQLVEQARYTKENESSLPVGTFKMISKCPDCNRSFVSEEGIVVCVECETLALE